MKPVTAPDIAVVIPARNEEERIAACLAALAGQCPGRVAVILVVNNTTDRTEDVARDAAGQLGLDLTVLSLRLGAQEGVGTARRIGCDHALRSLPALRYLFTTDADGIVDKHWISRTIAHLKAVDAVCGKIEPMAREAGILAAMDRHLGALEGLYRRLVQDFYARHVPGCADLAGTHGEAAGASLAFTRDAFVAAGGFAPIKCGEDRRIVRTLRGLGCKVRHADDVTVQVSCRLSGRAAGGMSDALRARIGQADYLIDDCLPPADWLTRRAYTETLGPWPPLVPTRFRIKVCDLPRHIEMLKTYRNSEWLIPAPDAPAATLSQSVRDSEAPEWGSATVPADPRPQTRRDTFPGTSVAILKPTVGTADPERSPR
ncbi:glycosyltransferase family 2 protein [Maritimibacter sp. DP1N21-5]|uniref:glycosyltransferase n=1 Tax=Maritimibacter sp. DP1N21-5 TaxID=2836867 RepID=UPI001C490DD9|nr:glycosyltransferase family 2 protein [Maritimibacter sp. DP1N21-5]MBV7411091.1 glycosyltransferase family 2 protein [Maritimibacter sp. DP1N21-5]